MHLFSLDINPVVWALLGVALFCAAILLILLVGRLNRIRRRIKIDSEAEPLDEHRYPPVSVIVYSQGDSNNLRSLLPQLLHQDYPAPMEVIVVNDESDDNTVDVVSELELRYSNLYLTFAPKQSRNLSRKKLSLTLGVKAAHYDALLFTGGNCRIESDKWIRSMARHFARGKEVVLGYASETDAQDLRVQRRVAFDFVWDSIRWLNSAIRRHPFMGTSYNLGYTKRLFLRHKGFSNTLNYKYGDDDLFVNEIATGDNCAVELSDDSRVIARENPLDYMHRVYRGRRLFTSRELPRLPYLGMSLINWLAWLLPLSSIAAAILGLPSIIPAIAGFVITITTAIILMVFWRKASVALGMRKLLLTVPLLLLWHPFFNVAIRNKARASHDDNYTWG